MRDAEVAEVAEQLSMLSPLCGSLTKSELNARKRLPYFYITDIPLGSAGEIEMKVFISHSSKDKPTVEVLAKELELALKA